MSFTVVIGSSSNKSRKIANKGVVEFLFLVGDYRQIYVVRFIAMFVYLKWKELLILPDDDIDADCRI